MAGDTLRDAFRAKLDAILQANPSITWARIDTLNTGIRPDASTGYFELEFPGGGEQQYTFGAPGANLHREQGQVTLRAVVHRNAGKTERDNAESYIETIRDAFRMARFAAGSRTVRITATGAMGGGQDEAGMWAESIALFYQVFNTG
jgi:hypothetical protein